MQPVNRYKCFYQGYPATVEVEIDVARNIPVLIVKHKPANLQFETVVFPCDFSEEMVKPYLEACQFFDKSSSNLKLLYVNLPGERFQSSAEVSSVGRT